MGAPVAFRSGSDWACPAHLWLLAIIVSCRMSRGPLGLGPFFLFSSGARSFDVFIGDASDDTQIFFEIKVQGGWGACS